MPQRQATQQKRYAKPQFGSLPPAARPTAVPGFHRFRDVDAALPALLVLERLLASGFGFSFFCQALLFARLGVALLPELAVERLDLSGHQRALA